MNSVFTTYSERYTYPYAQGTMKLYAKDKSWFRVCFTVANMSTYKRYHVGCIAVLNHRIISSGYNTCKSEPLQKEFNSVRFSDTGRMYCNHTSHAEVKCLKPLMQNNDVKMSKVKLYIGRTRKNGTPALARPCISCMKMIKESGIRWIYYSGDNEYFKEDVVTGKMIRLVP